MAQFLKMMPDHKWKKDVPIKDVSRTPDCPAAGISWYDAAKYCRKLSELEDIPEQEAGVYLKPDMGVLVSFLKPEVRPL